MNCVTIGLPGKLILSKRKGLGKFFSLDNSLRESIFREDQFLYNCLQNTIGYRAAIDKKKGLSPKHVRLALDEMAKYHALGYAWMKNYPGGIEQALKDEEVGNHLY